MSILSELSRSGDEGYQSAINSAVRGLWQGVLTRADFQQSMTNTIGRWLTIAWREGMTDAGVDPDNMSAAEDLALARLITGEDGFVSKFGDDIQAGNKASGGKLQPFLDRAATWAKAYGRAKELARMMANADQKLEWVIGKTEKHCRDCLRLNGKVKRASTWLDYGVRPQSRELECHGYNCDCSLKPTKKPISKGALPRLANV